MITVGHYYKPLSILNKHLKEQQRLKYGITQILPGISLRKNSYLERVSLQSNIFKSIKGMRGSEKNGSNKEQIHQGKSE